MKYIFILAIVGAGLLVSSAVFAQTYSEGMVSYWKLDESSGTTAFDSIGTNNGTLFGPSWTTGKVDGALNFGGSDYVEAPNAASLNPEHLTLEA